MRKNNKGFTLIELLAAIAILSILMVLALPQITNLIGNNRDKVYVSDALKMISQAEYKLRTNSTIIEKPDDGECIIFSLNYLDNNSFDNPPNKGEYLRYASFVVVKNDGGKLEYSALLVEEYSNSYKGVKLTKETDLNKSDAIKYVTPFDKDSIVYINDDISAKYGGGEDVNKTIDINYINQYLGDDYVSAVDDRLVNEIVEQDEEVENLGVPRINSFIAMSASGSDYNLMDMKIIVEAKDSDTPPSDLTVYYNICTPKIKETEPSLCDYPDITNPSVSGYPYVTNGNATFSSPVIDLSSCNSRGDLCAHYGEEVVIYLMVVDKDGNYTQKLRNYPIHNNEPPVIKKFEIIRREGDTANFLKAQASIDVSDDIDTIDKLQYCITTDANATECNNYQPLPGLKFPYDFCTGNIFGPECLPDGRARTVKLFVKDSLDAVGTPKTYEYHPYNLNLNDIVTKSQFSVETAGSDVPSGKKSLLVSYSLNVKFDADSGIEEEDIHYELGLCDNDTCAHPTLLTGSKEYSTNKTGTYQLYRNSELPLYNGETRKIVALIYIDKYGLSSDASKTIKKTVKYTPYLNLPPAHVDALKEVFIDLEDDFDGQKSPETGTYNTKFRFNYEDDLDGRNIWACFSENANGCNYSNETEFKSKFSKYSQEMPYVFTPIDSNFPYDGSKKTVNIKVCDKYYLTAGMNSCTSISRSHNIYKNKQAVIEDAEVASVTGDYNSYNTKVSLDISDDLEDINNIWVTMTDGINTIEDYYGNLFGSSKQADFEFGDHSYDGKERKLTIKLEDSYRDSSTGEPASEKTYSYFVSKNNKPSVTFSVSPQVDAWTNNNFPVTSSMPKGSYDASILLNIDDNDTWDDGKVKYCISEDPNGCTNLSSYSLFDENEVLTHTFQRPANFAHDYQDVDNRKLYVWVKDVLGEPERYEADYNMYVNQGPNIGTPTIVPNYTGFEDYPDIQTDNIHVNRISVSTELIDDFDDPSQLSVRIGYAKGNSNTYTYTNSQPYQDEMIFTIGDSIENFNYDGATYKIKLEVTDSFGKTSRSESHTPYKVYKKGSPQLVNANFYGNCDYDVDDEGFVDYDDEGNPKCDTPLPINSSTFFIEAQVKNYFDTFDLCVSESSDTCTDYTNKSYSGNTPYTGYETKVYHLENYDYSKPSPTKVYLFIKSSDGTVKVEELDYDIYETCQKNEYMIEKNITHTAKDSKKTVTAKSCNGECYANRTAQGVIDEPPERIFAYEKKYDLYDLYSQTTLCKKNQKADETLYCSYETCFYDSSGNPSYDIIGLVVRKTTNEQNQVTQYTYNCDGCEYEGKKFTDYHYLYRIEMVDGSYEFVRSDDLIPDKLIGVTDYNYREQYPFDYMSTSYIVFNDND